MLTIYGVYRSRASRNFWLLAELGMEFEHVPVIQGYRLPDPEAEDAPFNTLSPGFLSVSPAGAVPVLKDGDFVLSESLAMNLYLARKAGGPLAPSDARENALMEQWALYGATSVESHALAIMYAHAEGRAKTPEGEAEIAAETARLRRPLGVLNSHLREHGHMVGGRFTVADINMAEILRYAQSEPGLIPAYPAIAAWLTTCHARPAFKEMWERRLAEPA
ncbi:glutathione S-transferase family protein [Defluviimonas sp. WL0024]|uniref:Glutathione S-transferase family protein n=1 Tax=Albidovulum salinarum TaxID=2984153 RepID=A0ABT2X106_9RHOB|nr:glutathione S-transferase family protein [Defluviimonas sp. WL0024]MCU9847617.1 glutathione S-transferase family protein [Defluviimonas sp. WL0024]